MTAAGEDFDGKVEEVEEEDDEEGARGVDEEEEEEEDDDADVATPWTGLAKLPVRGYGNWAW
jgi:hypothetical protein